MVVRKSIQWGAASMVLVAAVSLSAFQARTSPAAFVVLDASKVAAWKTDSTKVPPGWNLKINAGTPDITLSDTAGDQGNGPALHFRSNNSSFGLERAVDIDPAKLPYLSWDWMVTKLPQGGDFRRGSRDDQAAQVMVAFDDRHIITYLWDSTAPQGTMESASFIPFVHIFGVVCRSGGTDVNKWLMENRDVAADYQKAFGKPAVHVKGLRLQINSQHTGSSAESYFGEVAFHSAQS
jgi:hypothetical protein